MIEKKGGRPAGDEFQNGKNTPTPWFFVSVASKGFSSAVSLLFATLAGESISVAAKGLMGAGCWRESNGLGCEDFGGVRRTAWAIEALGKRAGMGGRAPSSAKATAGRRKNLADLTKPLWHTGTICQG